MSLFLASFLAVFLKAFQQRNVVADKYWAVPIVSFGMAFSEVFIVLGVVDYGLAIATVLLMGSGGTLGCLSAMIAHKRMFR